MTVRFEDSIHKYLALDFLRGVAAINVLLYHFYLLNHSENNLYRPANFFMAGHEAVIFFFVLSGFVLSRSLYVNAPFFYLPYCVKRIFRIMPAYYVAMILAVVVYTIIKPTPLNNLSEWFNGLMPSIQAINLKIILATIFVAPSNKLNGVVWSLSYELFISVLYLPWLTYLLKKVPQIIVIFLFVIVVLFIIYPPQHFIAASFYYTIFFIFGMLLNVKRTNNPQIIWFLPIFIVLYYNKFWLTTIFNYNESFRDILTGCGSVGFIIMVLTNQRISDLFSKKLCLFSGKISYSLYLLHVPLIYFFTYLLLSIMDLIYIKLLIFIGVILLAWLTYIYIELPCIKLGKSANKIFEKSYIKFCVKNTR